MHMSSSIDTAAHLAIMWPFVAHGMPVCVATRMRLVRKVPFFDRMSLLIGWWHVLTEFFGHHVCPGLPENACGGPIGRRLFATKLALLIRKGVLKKTPFLHVRVQSQAIIDGAAPGLVGPDQ